MNDSILDLWLQVFLLWMMLSFVQQIGLRADKEGGSDDFVSKHGAGTGQRDSGRVRILHVVQITADFRSTGSMENPARFQGFGALTGRTGE